MKESIIRILEKEISNKDLSLEEEEKHEAYLSKFKF